MNTIDESNQSYCDPGEHIIEFGKYSGLQIKDVATQSPWYIAWLSGVVTKFSLKQEVKESYIEIKKAHPDIVRICREYIKDRCSTCMEIKGKKHVCSKVTPSRNYHYHPYGKRD